MSDLHPDDIRVPESGVRLYAGDFGPRSVYLGKAATPQRRNEAAMGSDIGMELGRSGLRHWGGFVFEEWLNQLQQGQQAAQVYRDMMDSDPIVGAIMYAIQSLMRRVTWWCEPGEATAATGSKREAQQGADWFDGVRNDMQFSWEDTLGEHLSFLGYGWNFSEECYKKRLGDSRDEVASSTFDDGAIGISKIPLRSQDSIWKWVFNEVGDIEGMIQNPPPDYLLRFIPTEKALHFRTTIFKNDPLGRALAADTQIPTPTGWKRMDELAVGDEVYDESGQPTPVVGIAAWDNRPCYEVMFSAGHSVIADENHLWSVTPGHARWGAKPQANPTRLLTTLQMFEKMEKNYDTRLSAGLAPRLAGHNDPLPLDPYILGYWLGDGNSRDGRIAYGERDLPHLLTQIEVAGFTHTDYGKGYLNVAGLKPALRGIGVLGVKHIPDIYLRASVRDRLALLQGLMDSDGSIGGRGSCMFFNSDQVLLADVEELIRTLGGIPHIQVSTKVGHDGGVVNGRRVIATKSNFKIYFSLDRPAFRLQRKAERQEFKRSNRVSGHNIARITKVASQRTVCIQVGKPLGLFLAGRGMVPTHNSILRSAYQPWYMARNHRAIEGIGVERDLAGLPVLTPPEGTDIWDAKDPSMAGVRLQAQNLVSSIRRDEQEGVLIPFGWTLELLSAAGSRQFDTSKIITRYETRIATSVLADLVMMGQDKVGSYALAVTKKDLFSASLGAFLDIIANQYNTRTIPRLWRLNGFTGPRPKLCHGQVETIDLDTLGNYIMRLGQSGAPIDWETVLPWANDQAGMPQPKPGHDFSPRSLSQTVSDRGPSDRLVAKADDEFDPERDGWEGRG